MTIRRIEEGFSVPLELVFQGECGRLTEVAVAGINFRFRCIHGQGLPAQVTPVSAEPQEPPENPRPIDFEQGPLALSYEMDPGDLNSFVSELAGVNVDRDALTFGIFGDPGGSDLKALVEQAAKEGRPLRLVFGYGGER
ncbi:hypothetical protein ACFWNR_01910 [Streptomyces virginiae]|uniref:hypothetical protein n=1 Tax=Streptomyces virginiae TaxID=1961 RepID=UPI0036491DFA